MSALRSTQMTLGIRNSEADAVMVALREAVDFAVGVDSLTHDWGGGSKMRMRAHGRNGLEVSAAGLGCMGMNYHRGPAPGREQMIALTPEDLRHIEEAASNITVQGGR
jgi:hypothetical protein